MTRPKRERGLKPGLAEAVGAMHDMISLDSLSVNAAAIVVARQMRNWWLAAWTRNAERSDDLDQLSRATLADQLRTAYHRTYR